MYSLLADAQLARGLCIPYPYTVGVCDSGCCGCIHRNFNS